MKKVIIITFMIITQSMNITASKNTLHAGETGYVAIADIRPGQMRYSQKNIDLKINEVRKKNGIKNGTLAHDNGHSAFTIQGAAPVMKIKDREGTIKYILADKHHDTLADIKAAQEAQVNNPTMPVKVEKDFSSMNYDDFLHYADKNYLIDLMLIDGKKATDLPTRFDQMANDPVRYFVTISARKVGNGEVIEKSIGADFPLWLKRLQNSNDPKLVGDTANARMIENIISQKLLDNGFTYDADIDGEAGVRFNGKVAQAHGILSRPNNAPWLQKTGVRLVMRLDDFEHNKNELAKLASEPDPLAQPSVNELKKAFEQK